MAITTPKCPKCKTSDFVVLVNTGEKVGAAVGGTAAAAGGFAAAAAATSAIPSPASKIASALVALAPRIAAAVSAGTVGVYAGAKLGEGVDKSRKLFKCNNCDRLISG